MPLFKPDRKETPILLHPPLLEAIFEVRWEMETDPQTNRMRDPSYPMLYGRLYERLKKELPIIEDLPSVQAHPETTPYVPRHRMRKDKNSYPLLQIGPGIVTINEAKGYEWSRFSQMILQVINALVEISSSYEERGLNFIKSELRYVNGIRFDLARENPLSFLAEKLHMKLEMDPALFEQVPIHERPNGLGLNLSFALEKPMGNLSIAANLGQFDNKPAIIQQTLIQSFGELTPSDRAGFAPWIEEAHAAAESCFQIFCKGPLMEKFASE